MDDNIQYNKLIEENLEKGIGLPSRKTVFRLYDTIAALKAAKSSSSLSRKMEGYK